MLRTPASIATLLGLTLAIASATTVRAQDIQSRTALIEDAEKLKAENLKPAEPGKAEAYVERISDTFLSGNMHWHAFWQNAYSGGGFTVGAGYLRHVSAYNLLDVRASITPSGYKRIEVAVLHAAKSSGAAARCRCSAAGAKRRRSASTDSAKSADREPRQLRLPAAVSSGDARGLPDARAIRAARRRRGRRSGSRGRAKATVPSVDTVYTPATLPGLGAGPSICTPR